MVEPNWIWMVFVFVFGCCVGSFLNVVVYRLPLDKSLISPGSACAKCGEYIRFYDNIPLVSWLLLGRKCRYCRAPISPRYFIIELLTGIVFLGVFMAYFHLEVRSGVSAISSRGLYVYLLHIILLSALIAASAIDLQLWVIPISICLFATAVGLVGSSVAGYLIEPNIIRGYAILPSAPANIAALTLGAVIGLAVALAMLATGLIKRSYEQEEPYDAAGQKPNPSDDNLNHRLEVCREVVFLLPIIICSAAAFAIFTKIPAISSWWVNFSQIPLISGFLGSLWGYFVGCGLVWSVRILGTLGFGKEAMGLGDVHLMGAAGAFIGPVLVVLAFFIAPFMGLAWALSQMFFKKTHQIPYGPFLSLGILAVIILHDWVYDWVYQYLQVFLY